LASSGYAKAATPDLQSELHGSAFVKNHNYTIFSLLWKKQITMLLYLGPITLNLGRHETLSQENKKRELTVPENREVQKNANWIPKTKQLKMKKTFLILLITTLTTFASIGQPFEGKIIYTNSYKSKMPNVTDGQFTSMMGATQEYFIKNGNYKSLANGTFLQSQYYVSSENKLYTKMANSEAFLWNDGATNPDEVLKSEVNKGVTEILGYKCDELVLTCKSGIQKYYFNSKLSVDD